VGHSATEGSSSGAGGAETKHCLEEKKKGNPVAWRLAKRRGTWGGGGTVSVKAKQRIGVLICEQEGVGRGYPNEIGKSDEKNSLGG